MNGLTGSMILRTNARSYQGNRIQSRGPKMAVELLVNFNEFWSRLRADMAQAQDSIWIQTFAFEGDSVGQELARALLAAPACDQRILADSFTRVVLSDRFRYSP